MGTIIETRAGLNEKIIFADMKDSEIIDNVTNLKNIVILKKAIPPSIVDKVRNAVIQWGKVNPPVSVDDFNGNYHIKRVRVSNIQQAPHVFHDYNFNDFDSLTHDFSSPLIEFFEPIRLLYNRLTGYKSEFGVQSDAPYPHPQIIHYPKGGSFFARHSHNLIPQKIGIIIPLSRYGLDYFDGGTVFDIDGKEVDLEGIQDIGDICLWRYDYEHWVSQSHLREKFDWDSHDGRWVATFAYFNPSQGGKKKLK